MEKPAEYPFYDEKIDTRLLGVLFRCSHKLPHMVEENSSQRRVLQFIDHEHFESLNQKKLAEIMGIRQPSMSELLSKLEAKGQIERVRNPHKHMMNIQITDEGRAALSEMQAVHDDLMEHVFSGLDDDEKEQLYQLMSKLIKSWD